MRWSLNESFRRVVESAPAIIQIVLAATASFAFTHLVLGHANPIFAVTVAITSLGFTRDARPRRIVSTAIGMIVGIALSEVLLLLIGQGLWQLSIVLLIALTAARFLSGSSAFALTVGIQAMLVYIMPAPEGGAFIRSLDGLIGGATALIFTAIIPRDPRGLANNDASKLTRHAYRQIHRGSHHVCIRQHRGCRYCCSRQGIRRHCLFRGLASNPV